MGYWGRMQRNRAYYALADKNVNEEDRREKSMFERYRKYPTELMDAFSKAMIEAHKDDEINDLEFLYVYSYMMTELNFQKLADMYVVGYDSKIPSYATRQFVHQSIVWKALKVITERVSRRHDITNLFRLADQEVAGPPLPQLVKSSNKLLDTNGE